jgi:hypothetical protein
MPDTPLVWPQEKTLKQHLVEQGIRDHAAYEASLQEGKRKIACELNKLAKQETFEFALPGEDWGTL